MRKSEEIQLTTVWCSKLGWYGHLLRENEEVMEKQKTTVNEVERRIEAEGLEDLGLK